MTPHRSASTNITGYSYVSQDRLLATTIKVVGTFDGESISRYGFQWALDGNNWHDVVLYNGSWTNVMNITAEKNIKISALQGSVYLRSFITRKDYDTTYSPSILYRYNNVIRMNVGELITNDFTRNARASEINVEGGFQYVLPVVYGAVNLLPNCISQRFLTIIRTVTVFCCKCITNSFVYICST